MSNNILNRLWIYQKARDDGSLPHGWNNSLDFLMSFLIKCLSPPSIHDDMIKWTCDEWFITFPEVWATPLPDQYNQPSSEACKHALFISIAKLPNTMSTAGLAVMISNISVLDVWEIGMEKMPHTEDKWKPPCLDYRHLTCNYLVLHMERCQTEVVVLNCRSLCFARICLIG